MANALYICYFGLRQPLVQTQVLPYLRELIKAGHKITLLTFEPEFRKKWTPNEIGRTRSDLAAEGITWEVLAYHKRPSSIATAYDIFRGALKVKRLIATRDIDLLHGRVHVPTLMGALGRRLSGRKPKLLFDIRGFFPEEYTDAGIWPENGGVYRTVKRVEKWLMKESDGFVVLTETARDTLFPEAVKTGVDKHERPVKVIPCCVDLEGRFAIDRDKLRAEFRGKLGIVDRFVFVHVGALGGLYLTEQIADFLQAVRSRDPRTFAIFLTQSDPELIVPLLRERGFTEDDFYVGQAAPADVPGYLCASDVGLSFVKAGYATRSRSPTKIPEYLACGLPIVANAGVGDVDALIERDQIGVVIQGFDDDSFRAGLGAVDSLGKIGDVCRSVAAREFDLTLVGGDRYRAIYRELTASKNDQE